jgi:hypothetical protein
VSESPAGSHTVDVRFESGAAGSVRVFLNTAGSGTITADGPAVAVSASRPGAITQLTFDAVAGAEVSMALGGITPSEGPPGLCAAAQVVDPFGSPVASVETCGAPFATTPGLVRLANNGVHVIEVSFGQGTTGTGELFLNAPDLRAITVDGDAQSVAISRPGDVSVLSVDGASGTTVVLTQRQIANPTGSCGETAIYDANGVYLDGLYTCLSPGQEEATFGVVLSADETYQVVHWYDSGTGQEAELLLASM